MSDVFAYEHGKEGEVLRSLAYTGDEGWVLVEGMAEPWEAAAFFGPATLKAAQGAADDEPDEARWAREMEDVKAGRLVDADAILRGLRSR